MSAKQMKKLIIGVVVMLVIMVAVVCLFLFVDFDSLGGTVDIEQVKAEGNYEAMKLDIADAFAMRDSQVASVADGFFEDIGIKKYESTSRQEARRGNVAVYADGYKFDAFVVAGDLANAYIGNVLVYKNPKVSSSTVANAPEYTYSQFDTFVGIFQKALKIEDAKKAKDLYTKLTMLDISSFSNAKKAKVNGQQGFIGYEGALPYFIVFDANQELKSIHIVCDGFDPIEVYNSSSVTGKETANNYKVLFGGRTTMPDSLTYRLGQMTGKTVTLAPALGNGDDSWLMVKYNDEIYLESRCDIGEVGGATEDMKSENIVVRLDANTRDIKYLKIGKKVYVGE